MKNVKQMSKRGLSLILAFVMCFSMLNLTAFAAGESYDCGKEAHTHTDACYAAVRIGDDLICSKEAGEGAHTHSDECYGEPVLSCGQTETEGHSHSEDCYTTETVTKYVTVAEEVEETYTYEVEESVPVTKTETYEVTGEDGSVSTGTREVTEYETRTVTKTGTRTVTVEKQVEDGTEEVTKLTCSQVEAAPHTHSDSCFTRPLVCGQTSSSGHQHSDVCYETETRLVCGKEEHIHSAECVTEKTDSVTGAEEVPADVQAFLDAVALIPALGEITLDDYDVIMAASDAWDAVSYKNADREDFLEADAIFTEAFMRLLELDGAPEGETFDQDGTKYKYDDWQIRSPFKANGTTTAMYYLKRQGGSSADGDSKVYAYCVQFSSHADQSATNYESAEMTDDFKASKANKIRAIISAGYRYVNNSDMGEYSDDLKDYVSDKIDAYNEKHKTSYAKTLSTAEALTATQCAIWNVTDKKTFTKDNFTYDNDFTNGEKKFDYDRGTSGKKRSGFDLRIYYAYDYLTKLSGEKEEKIPTVKSVSVTSVTPRVTGSGVRYDISGTVTLSSNAPKNLKVNVWRNTQSGDKTVKVETTVTVKVDTKTATYTLKGVDGNGFSLGQAKTGTVRAEYVDGQKVRITDITLYQHATSQNFAGITTWTEDVSVVKVEKEYTNDETSINTQTSTATKNGPNGEPLQGVTFQLYVANSDGSNKRLYSNATYTTNASGKVEVKNLPKGLKYTFEEVKSIDGYVKGSTTSVESGGTLTNQYDAGQLTISKTVVGVPTSQKFKMTVTLDLSTSKVSLDKSSVVFGGTTYTKNADGTYSTPVEVSKDAPVTLSGIPLGATFTVTEVGGDNLKLQGGVGDDKVYTNKGTTPSSATITASSTANVTNELWIPADTTLELYKNVKLNDVDEPASAYTNEFTFKLEQKNDSGWSELGTSKNGENGKVTFSLNDLWEGEYVYRISEVSGDTNKYQFAADPFYAKVVVTEDSAKQGYYKADMTYYTDEALNTTVDRPTFENVRQVASLNVTKTVSWNVNQSHAPEAGAEFTFKVQLGSGTDEKALKEGGIYNGDGVYTLTTALTGDALEAAEVDEDGNKTATCAVQTINGIPTGTAYKVEEVAPGTGYYTNLIAEGNVEKNASTGTTFQSEVDTTETGSVTTTPNDTTDVTVYNRYFKSLPVEISVTKSWGEVTEIDSLIPTYIGVELHQTDSNNTDKVVGKEDLKPESWTHTFEKLDKWESENMEYVYTIVETGITYGDADAEGLVEFLNKEDKTASSDRGYSVVEKVTLTKEDGKTQDIFKVLGTEETADGVKEVLGVFAADYKDAKDNTAPDYTKALDLANDWTRARNEGSATLTIRKAAEDGSTALNGAVFTVKGGTGKYKDGVSVATDGVTYSLRDPMVMGTAMFDFDWSDVGEYTLTETTAPDHYTQAAVHTWKIVVERQLSSVTSLNGVTFQNNWNVTVKVVNVDSGKEVLDSSETGDEIDSGIVNNDLFTKIEDTEDIFMQVVNERLTSSLTVGKTYSGNATDPSREWNFTITLEKPVDEPWVVVAEEYPVLYYDGKETAEQAEQLELDEETGVYTMHLTMKAGTTATITGLPVEMTYTVVEDEANQDGYTTTATKNGANDGVDKAEDGTPVVTGTVKEAAVDQVIFNNYRYRATTGSLTIVKTVSGGGDEAASKTYTFTVTGPNGYSETVTVTGAGRATLRSLRPGTYTVTEADASIEGYTWEVSGEGSVNVTAGSTASITITNTYDEDEEFELPDPDTPLTDLPDGDTPLADLPDEDIPLADAPEEEEEFEIPDPDIPLADVPTTGDSSGLWLTAGLASALGLAATLFRKKKED